MQTVTVQWDIKDQSGKKRQNASHAFGRIFLLAILALVIGLKVYNWNAGIVVGNSMPMPFGYGASVVLSGSMEPVLSVNDLVFIHETVDIEVGDVVVYERDGELIIHRVISFDGGTVVTQGDANNVADEPFDISAVKGKLVGHIPKLGALVRMIKTTAGTLILLTAAFLLLELSYRKEREKDEQDIEAIKAEIRKLKEGGSGI